MVTHKPKELHFNQERYNGYKESIYNHVNNLIIAAAELHRLGLTNVKSEDLKDGNMVQRLLTYHRKEHAANTALKQVRFEKYIDLIELEYGKLQEIEDSFLSYLDFAFTFYPVNNEYFSYCKHRDKEQLCKAGKQVELKMSELFEIKGTNISVKLPEKYFKLYSTNDKQLAKIDDINAFFNAAKTIGAKHKSIKEVLGNWILKLDYNLENYELNYNQILKL